MKNLLIIIFLISSSIGLSQQLKIDSVQVISRAKDTISAELGKFYVQTDRKNNSVDSIELAFVRLKSTNPNPGSPIVYLSGGPGGSGTNTIGGDRFELFMKLREVADVIAFDQRGTGLSEALPACPYRANFESMQAYDRDDYVKKSTDSIKKCLKFWEEKNINLEAYNTTESAKDIEDLRKVLKTDKLSLWGISYGSHLAFEYIRLYEDKIDKMVLASLEGPNETIKLPKNTEDFLFKIADLAEDNYGSEVKYPDLKDKIIEVHRRLKEKPVTSTFIDRGGNSVDVKISNFELQSAISTFYLKNPEDSKEIPKVYSKMYNGDFSDVASDVWVVKKYIYSGIRPMSFSMDMQSGISKDRAVKVEKQIDNSILGSTINFLLFDWMKALDYPMLSDDFRKLKSNKVDALLLSGTLDGRTYLSSAKQIAKNFKNGQHVIIENAGHDLFMSTPLIGDMIQDFFLGNPPNTKKISLNPTYFD